MEEKAPLNDKSDHKHTVEAIDDGPDIYDIELELISLGFVAVSDEYGNTNWVNPNLHNNSASDSIS